METDYHDDVCDDGYVEKYCYHVRSSTSNRSIHCDVAQDSKALDKPHLKRNYVDDLINDSLQEYCERTNKQYHELKDDEHIFRNCTPSSINIDPRIRKSGYDESRGVEHDYVFVTKQNTNIYESMINDQLLICKSTTKTSGVQSESLSARSRIVMLLADKPSSNDVKCTSKSDVLCIPPLRRIAPSDNKTEEGCQFTREDLLLTLDHMLQLKSLKKETLKKLELTKDMLIKVQRLLDTNKVLSDTNEWLEIRLSEVADDTLE